MAYEKIDEAAERTSAYDRLTEDTLAYISSEMDSVKDRLALERAIRKYSESNTVDWLLNLIISINERRKKKETRESNTGS